MMRGPAWLTAMIVLMVIAAPAQAAPGDLDASFGVGGFARQILPSYTYTTDVVPGPGGKTYLAGASNQRPFVIRVNPDGTPDATFGSMGRVTLYDNTQSSVYLGVQSDGAIVVAYSTGSYVRVNRLRTDGSSDAGYHGDFYPPNSSAQTSVSGLELTADDRAVIAFRQSTMYVKRLLKSGAFDPAFGTAEGRVATGLSESGGGLVLVGSYTYVAGTVANSKPAIARLDPAGMVDTAWGTGGIFQDTLPAPYTYGWFNAITLSAGGGGLLAVGTATNGSDSNVLIEQIAGNGSALDSGFGAGGRTIWDSASTRVHDTAHSVGVQNSGRIIVGAQGGYVTALGLTVGGALDPGFGSGGVATTATSNGPAEAAVQPDGKVIISGEGFAGVPLTRFTLAGSLDLSFAGDGATAVQVGAFTSLTAVASAPEGTTVASGYTYRPHGPYGSGETHYDCVVVRRLPDGSPDVSFSEDGLVIIDDFGCPAVAARPDGSIFLGGGSNGDLAVLRLKADGSINSDYGTGGYARVNAGGSGFGTSMVVLGDGKVVVGGGLGGSDFVAVRFGSDGSPDPGFGNGGVAVVDLGGYDYAAGLAIGPGGSVVLAGSSRPSGPQNTSLFAVVRLKPDGAPDAAFGSNGHVIVGFGGSYEQAEAVAVSTNGSVVATGSSADKAAITRLTTTGAPDPSFASGGKLLLGFGRQYSSAADVLVTEGDKIVVLGRSSDADVMSAALARLTPAGILDEGFGSGGKAKILDGVRRSLSALASAPDGKFLVAGSEGDLGLLLGRVAGDPPPPGPSGGTVGGDLAPGASGRASLTNLRLSPTRFRAAAKGASIAAGRRPTVGTTVSFKLSADARVTFTVERKVGGMLKGKRCVAPYKPKRGTRARSCKRTVAMRGSFSFAGKAGPNRIRFSGRLARHRLAPRSYTLVARPAGGAAARRAFKVVLP